MKQARRWLLLAAALVLLPQAAYAQKKKPKAGSAAPPAAAPAGETPAAPADMDADAPATPAGTPPAGGDTGTPAAGGEAPAAGGEMDICSITPDAPQCTATKEINLGVEAKKTVNAEVYAVQQQYVIKAQRFEIQPYFAVTLNDQFVTPRRAGPGAQLLHHASPRGRRQRSVVRLAERRLGLQLPESPRSSYRGAAQRLSAKRRPEFHVRPDVR